ncbi:MAG TPA: AAA domain-containing protein [Tepidisphaeraceae bacterium]|jgi:hypothetical protein
MIEPNNPILSKMLERLFVGMMDGPSMNCRPHASRQRMDLVQLEKLKDLTGGQILLSILREGEAKLTARVPLPSRAPHTAESSKAAKAEEKALQHAWSEQYMVRNKLRLIAEDARTYEQDTGVHALQIGFPVISLPPGVFGGRVGAGSRRVLAPIAFIPATMTVKTGSKQAVDLGRRGEANENLIIPNIALLAWLEQQSGRQLPDLEELKGVDPWGQLCELTRVVAQLVECSVPPELDQAMPAEISLAATPSKDDGLPIIAPAAVLGLFPTANEGLLRDTREMLAKGVADGPITSFIRLGVTLENLAAQAEKAKIAAAAEQAVKRIFAEERLITDADPCQARAVRLAQMSRGLVVHGPPGTGKSQTITNIISDHLARGQRVLFVSDKRTALDVVADRLNVQGLGDLCATVHDPKHDQKEFYRSVREQLDGLVDAPLKPRAAEILGRIDAELQTLHDDLLSYHKILIGNNGGPGSFHHLVGLWLSEMGNSTLTVDDRPLRDLPAGELEKHTTRLKEVLERGEAAGYSTNQWKDAAGVALVDFLSTSMESYRSAMNECVRDAEALDATRDPVAPGFDADVDLSGEAESRKHLATQLKQVLSKIKPADAAAWSNRPDGALASAREKIGSAREWINTLRSRRLDPTLLATAPRRASANQLHRDLEILAHYIKTFQAMVGDFARVRRLAKGADDETILKWIKAGRKSAASALKKLSGATNLVKAVDATTLDATLLARLQQNPIDSKTLIDYLATLEGYAQGGGKLFGIFGGGEKKKAAEGVARHFGMALSNQTAAELKDFLSKLQQRMDLASIVSSATGEALDNPPDDEQLIGTFKRTFAVVSALAEEKGDAPARNETVTVTDEVISVLNEQIEDASAPAAKILAEYRLACNPTDASRLDAFLRGLEARVRLTQVHEQLTEVAATDLVPDDVILKTIETHESLFDLLDAVRAAGASPNVAEAILRALGDPGASAGVSRALSDAPVRAAALAKLEKSMERSGLFDAEWLKKFKSEIRNNGVATATMAALCDRIGTLEGVLRVRDGLQRLPGPLAESASTLLANNANSGEGYSAIRRAVLAGEIARRLRQDPELQSVDGVRFKSTFDRYRELHGKKQALVKDVIRHFWIDKQKNRLLASGATRLNGLGADLRRRITGRGERAMRLRQVIAHGASVEGGDPLFELRPVWMASPETVAQMFPREPIFDVVVFDEASQCRLEDALPVLTRAKRVVIAGDPQQLPPTRFFESTVAVSDEEEIETEQELFEAHQAEVEDLLGAALGLDIQQCYLDVHYRSRNADLIGFSNEHFYHSRLQPIPDHPRNRTAHAPLTLYRVDGLYEKRTNATEADAVVKIVKNLLGRDNPPSIGIACFNMQQRDLIVEKLEELAEQDQDFAAKLMAARNRRGAGSSEGLFVKNLESVQGDERDHLIISTTFGTDAKGKFRRNFGPLGAAGGGRRLNVLITRARHEIHVVTSIPRHAYATLPPVPDGVAPTGVWLLFAYLNYCEQLQQDYEIAYRVIQNSGGSERAVVDRRKSKTPSNFAGALANRLASTHSIGSTVHWGNDGFCVDLALHHPAKAEDVTMGVICDTTRYSSQQDAVEWEVFRQAILEQQGWKLHRVWTPHFFRDPKGCLEQIKAEAEAAIESEKRSIPHAAAEKIAGAEIRESLANIQPAPQQDKDAA